MSNSNINRIIHDYFCDGFFGRDELNLEGSKIVGEGKDWIVIEKKRW